MRRAGDKADFINKDRSFNEDIIYIEVWLLNAKRIGDEV